MAKHLLYRWNGGAGAIHLGRFNGEMQLAYRDSLVSVDEMIPATARSMTKRNNTLPRKSHWVLLQVPTPKNSSTTRISVVFL